MENKEIVKVLQDIKNTLWWIALWLFLIWIC
jgi:hypothetical protein